MRHASLTVFTIKALGLQPPFNSDMKSMEAREESDEGGPDQYRGTSLIKKRPPSRTHHRAFCIFLR